MDTEINRMTGKIAISVSNRNGQKAPVDERFGRAPYFLLANEDNYPLMETIRNEQAQAVHGAGTSVAALMARNGVTDVISGQFGPKAYTALEKLNVRMWVAPSGLSANQVLVEFFKGNLSQHKMKEYR